jgi:hypothetical protein
MTNGNCSKRGLTINESNLFQHQRLTLDDNLCEPARNLHFLLLPTVLLTLIHSVRQQQGGHQGNYRNTNIKRNQEYTYVSDNPPPPTWGEKILTVLNRRKNLRKGEEK